MAFTSVLGTLGGCIGCQAGLEQVQREVPNSLNLVTFSTFLLVSLEGLIFQSKFFSVKNIIPLRSYVKLVVIYFVVNLCNNYAMKFGIHFPLFIIFKSSNLIAHLVLRRLLQNHLYTLLQIASIVIVTAGVIIFTLASYQPTFEMKTEQIPDWARDIYIPPFCIGVFLLTVAITLSSYLGICQEELYAKYGSHHKEVMFYVHFLSLPAFAILGNEMGDALSAANNSPSFSLNGYNLLLPTAWVHILGVVALQWVCVNNVYRLTSLTSSLNVNMVICLRKFISLVVSFVIFGNPFNVFHLFGAIIVFIGTLVYAKVF